MVTEDGKFFMMDLPARYCRCRFKDLEGNNIVEFNTAYFDSLINATSKETALKTYPDFITLHYKKWKKGKVEAWCMLPAEMGVCFKFFDGLLFAPLFIDTIPASLNYDKSVDAENERAAEEIRKIIVQKIPHLSDGGLLFEPEEAERMHKGAVGMLKGNKNLSVLTTYADVEGIVSRTSSDAAAANTLEKMIQNVYYKTGVSGQVFGSNSNLALKISLENDKALMMLLVTKFNTFIEKVVNKVYRDKSIRFSFQFLPISWYDDEDVANAWFKMATSGYSFLMPALALGISQADFTNLKTLENDVLKLQDLLIPLKSAYTDSGENGAPSKNPEDKSDTTIAKEKSLDTGGSN